MKTIFESQDYKIKIGKNGVGEWVVAHGTTVMHLAYRRFFKTEEVAERWAIKLMNKMLKK